MRARRKVATVAFALLAVGIGLGLAASQLRMAPLAGAGGIEAQNAPKLKLEVEFVSTIGRDDTEGEATAWPSAPKLAVARSGTLHVVYQRRWGRGSPTDKKDDGDGDRWVYARSEDGGRTWRREEHPGRWPAVAVDDRDVVYVAFVERTAERDALWLWARAPGPGSRSDAWAPWAKRRLVQGPRRSLGSPALAVGPDALHLVWERHEGRTHRIEYARVPLAAWAEAEGEGGGEGGIVVETLAESPLGVYFPAIVADPRGRVVVVWEAAVDATAHRVDGAVRPHGGEARAWTLVSGISGDVGDARHVTLGLEGSEGVRVAFVGRGSGFRSALYTAAFSFETGRWGPPVKLREEAPQGLDPTQQTLLAFPATWGGLLLWGHTVPAACGTGPLYGLYFSSALRSPIDGEEGEGAAARAQARARAQAQELLGDFASYPHVREDPRAPGVFHLLWTDRDVEALRAFEVRYARLSARF